MNMYSNVFLFKKDSYTAERVEKLDYMEAYSILNGSFSVRFYQFDNEEIAIEFVNLKIIKRDYHAKIF